jgi:hypothetical protein
VGDVPGSSAWNSLVRSSGEWMCAFLGGEAPRLEVAGSRSETTYVGLPVRGSGAPAHGGSQELMLHTSAHLHVQPRHSGDLKSIQTQRPHHGHP